MPTFDTSDKFLKDWAQLTRAQRTTFGEARRLFVQGLAVSAEFHPALRVKAVQGHPRVMEITWAPDGRATWMWGREIKPGEPHIIWRRIGSHGIFREP